MARTRNGNLTGRAASDELRDKRQEIEDGVAHERKLRQAREQRLVELEKRLIQRCVNLEGRESFAAWYTGPAVPERGPAKERIGMIVQRIIRLEKSQKEAQYVERYTRDDTGA